MAGTESNDIDARARRRTRILRIVLVVSLALNLLVLGVMAGGVMKVAQTQRASHSPDLRALWMALPETARRDMRPGNGERSGMQRDERRARAAQRQVALLALLRAPEFDTQAFAEILMADHLERSARIARAHEALVEQISTLDATERAAMADRLHEEGRARGLSRR